MKICNVNLSNHFLIFCRNSKLFSAKHLILIFSLITNISFANDNSDSDYIKNYEIHKKTLIKKKLLLNSFEKCEEYINNSSVELFLNCNANSLNKKISK